MRNRSKKFLEKTLDIIFMQHNMISDISLYRKANVWTLEFDYTRAVYASEENVYFPVSYHVTYTIYKDGSYKFVDEYAL